MAAGERAVAADEASALAAVRELKAEFEHARRELEGRIEALEEALSSLEVLVIDGYFVKLWYDEECDVWGADCPTVKCVAQGKTREAVGAHITSAIEDMLDSLAELGEPLPVRDIPVRDAQAAPTVAR